MSMGIPASQIDWNLVTYFGPDEWPDDILEYLDSNLITAINSLRMRSGQRIDPSPLHDGWVRTDGSTTSRHYIGKSKDNPDRLSDAGDIFPHGDILQIWRVAVTMDVFGAVGLYTDTIYEDKPWPMLHLDIRARGKGSSVWWLRTGKQYYHFPARGGTDAETFYSALKELT